MKIQAHGLTVQAPTGLDARIYRRKPEHDDERTHPIVHLCTRSMPEDRGDYGSGVVDLLTADDVFISLMEFGPESVDTPLFAHKGMPAGFDQATFSQQALQRTLTGQSGAQYRFSEAGRAFCLYVVLGSHVNRRRLMARVKALVDTLQIEPSSARTIAPGTQQQLDASGSPAGPPTKGDDQ